MVGSNKILTVSYGTFSCTLEGFDDSFGTMKAIAEYFRDLAADDRYFGAEPPTPDAEMLARIAEREIDRRVEARSGAEGIVLRVGQDTTQRAAPAAAPAAATAPAKSDVETPAPEPMADPIAEAAPEVADTEDEIAAFVAPEADAEPEAVAPETAAPAAPIMPPAAVPPTAAATRKIVPPAFAAPEPASDDSVLAKLRRIQAVVGKSGQEMAPDGYTEDLAVPAVAEASPEPIVAPAADRPAEETVDEAPAAAPEVAPEQTPEAVIAEDVDQKADDSDEPADKAEDDSADEEPTPAARLARLVRMKQTDFEMAVAAGRLAPMDEDEDDDTATGADPEPVDEDAADETVAAIDAVADAPAFVDDEVATDNTPAEETAAEDTAPEEASTDDVVAEDTVAEDTVAEDTVADDTTADDVPVEDDAEEDDAVAAQAETDEEIDAVGADIADAEVATSDDDDAEVELLVGEFVDENDTVADEDDHEDIPAAARADLDGIDEYSDLASQATGTQTLAPEDEEELLRELAALETDHASETDEPVSDDTPEDQTAATAAPAPEATDEPADEAADDADDAAAATGPGRTRLEAEPAVDEVAVDRIMTQTDAELNTPESSRRRDAIAQLKAAVAATEAARRMGEAAHDGRTDESPFREDLRKVVRPQPVAADPERSQNRPDRPRTERPRPAPLKLVASQRVDQPADAAPARPAAPVTPRRVTVEPAIATPRGPMADSFAEFAAQAGAVSLQDLLEAAAAYTSFVEGTGEFSRPQILKRVQQAIPEPLSREDGLRAFGTLLRQGRIARTGNGRFEVAADTRFRPEPRAARG